MADNDYYFDGDPSTDSARRQLERLLKETKPRRKWPWIAAVVTGAAAWYFWPRDKGGDAATSASPTPAAPQIPTNTSRDVAGPERQPNDR